MENTGLKEALRNALEVFKFYSARKSENNLIMKEENVKIKIVVPILQELGWMSGNKEDVEFEYIPLKYIGKDSVDCCLEGNEKVFIELKAYKTKWGNKERRKNVTQLRKYCICGNVRYGVLTDGINWKLYGPYTKRLYIDNIVFNFEDVNNPNVESIIENFYPEAIDFFLVNDMFELDKIWKEKDLSVESILTNRHEYERCAQDIDKSSDIDAISDRLKYEMMSNGANIDIAEDNYKKFARKMKENIYPVRDVKQIFKGTMNELGIDSTSVDNIKDFVVSFLQKLGWEVEENNVNNNTCIVIKYNGIPVSIVMVKVYEGGKGYKWIIKDEENFFKSFCEKKEVRCGIITNGIKWKFYNCNKNYREKSCLFKSFVLKEDDKSIEQVADFLSMLSKDNIEELHCKVVGTRILDCILEEERNSELKREVIEASVSMDKEKIDMLAKKLHYKVLAMNPKIEVPEEYLKSYIRWYGTIYIVKPPKKGELSVTFPDSSEPINEQYDYLTFFKVIEKIGFERVAALGKVHTRDYPVVMRFNSAIYKESKWNLSSDEKYMVLKHYSNERFKTILEGIKKKLEIDFEIK